MLNFVLNMDENWVNVTSLIIPFERGCDSGFKLWMQTEWADFTGWISFLPSNLTEEINPNPKVLTTNN